MGLYSSIKKALEYINLDGILLNIDDKLKQSLLEETKLSYNNTGGNTVADYVVFDNDIIVNFNGKVVIQILMNQSTTAQLKIIPAGQTITYNGYINSGNILNSNSWYEFEFEVNDGDMINIIIQVPVGVVLNGYLRLFERRR